MKKITLNMSDSGDITDNTGYYIGNYPSAVSVDPDKEDVNSIDSIIKLKAAGFTSDEIIKLGAKL